MPIERGKGRPRVVAAAAGALAPEEQHCNTAAAGEPWSWEEVAAAARGHYALGRHARVWLRVGACRRWTPLPLKASRMGAWRCRLSCSRMPLRGHGGGGLARRETQRGECSAAWGNWF